MFKNAPSLTPESVKALNLLHSQVLITTNRGAKYLGKLARVGPKKFTLVEMTLLNKCETYKYHHGLNRDFNYGSTIKMEKAENYYEPKYEYLGRPTSREDACHFIHEGPRGLRLKVFQYHFQAESPEKFFEEHKDLEPEIWFDVLNAMHIPVKNPKGPAADKLVCYHEGISETNPNDFNLCFTVEGGRYNGKHFNVLGRALKVTFEDSLPYALRGMAMNWILMNLKKSPTLRRSLEATSNPTP